MGVKASPEPHQFVADLLVPLGDRPANISDTDWRRDLDSNRKSRKTAEFLIGHLPSLAYREYDPKRYKHQYTTALEHLDKSERYDRDTLRRILMGWHTLAVRVASQSGINVKLPPLCDSYLPSTEVFSQREYDLRRELNIRVDHWQRRDCSVIVALEPEDLLGEMLTSAVFNAGVLNPEAMVALAKVIAEGNPVQSAALVGGEVIFWVEVSYPSNRIGNVYRDGTLFYEQQIPLDSITVLWLSRCFSVTEHFVSSSYSDKDILRLVGGVLGVDECSIGMPGTLPGFLRIASGSYFDLSKVQLSEAILAVANGRQRCVTPRHDQWRAFLRPACQVVARIELPKRRQEGRAVGQKKGRATKNLSGALWEHVRSDFKSALADRQTNGGGKQGAKQAWSDLRSIDDTDWPIMARWLRVFYMVLFYEREGVGARDWVFQPDAPEWDSTRVPSTVRTDYHYQIGTRLMSASLAWGDALPSSEQVDEVVQAVYKDASTSGKARRRTGSALNMFIRVVSECAEDFPGANPIELPGERSGIRVRAALVSQAAYWAVRESLSALEGLSDPDRSTLIRIHDVLFWGAARESDLNKLRIRDLEEGGDACLFLAVTRLGTGKSNEAPRLVPLTTLLPESIRGEFVAWANRRRQTAALSDPLFECGAGSGLAWNPGAIGKILGALWKACGGIDDAVTYDSRHTRLTSWELLVEGCIDLAVAMGMYEPQHAQEVSAAILGPQSQTSFSYRQATHPSGHSEPDTLRQNYCHGHAAVMGLLLVTTGRERSLEELCTISGISRTRWRNALGDQAGPEPFAVQPVVSATVELLRLKQERADQGEPALQQPVQEDNVGMDQMTFSLVHKLLDQWTGGASNEELAERFSLPLLKVEGWTSTLSRLCRVTTRQGTSRLMGGRLGDGPIRWLPPVPHFDEGEKPTEVAFEVMRRQYASDPQRFRCALRHYFSVTYKDDSAVRFEVKQDLKDFLWLFGSAFSAKRWSSEIELAEGIARSAVERYWKHRLLDLKVKFIKRRTFARNPRGVLALRLALDETLAGPSSPSVKRKNSSILLKYMMPMVGMMILKEEDLEELGV